MTRIERVKKLCKWLIYDGFADNDAELAKNLGYTKSSFSQILNEKVPLSDKFIDKLSSANNNINKVWILDGIGEMLNNGVTKEPGLMVRKLKTDRIIDNQDIPLYDIQVAAGVVDLFGGEQKQIPVDYIRIPKLPKCDGALYVTGDSMYPLLKSGDIVMYKEIYNLEHNIIWGEMYLSYINNDGNEYFFTKFLKKSERDGYVQFVSQNQHHQTVEFPVSSIKALALVKASIRINSQL
ncbi:S24 family peptidase [Flavobacterium sp. GA093]|uniref:S24 family peptidase n=1 Tax=Flavobacterium hydrocarbonoxydans TaxID=2683249 RepID=A0A6I4NEJ6_9FLAO|nr:S24 family peptidase [Flavobacterium hydrocarbonoxydans]MWB92950.1 S24 family peptidase [Flavobacterium hydrocarbonoxydans]